MQKTTKSKRMDNTTDSKRGEKEIKKLDEEIDKEIYKIYNLTKEEIKIVEDSLKMIENNKQFLEELCHFELEPHVKKGPLVISHPKEKNKEDLRKLCKNFISQNKSRIEKIENHKKLISDLKNNEGKHEFFDKFLELFTAVALTKRFTVKYNINTNKEPDLTISKTNKEYNIEVKNKLRTFSQKNILKKEEEFQCKLRQLLNKKFKKGLNVIEFSIQYVPYELGRLKELIKQKDFLNLFKTLEHWEKNTDEIIDIISKYCDDASNINKYSQLSKLAINGFMLDMCLCKYNNVNINRNKIVRKNIELPQYLDITKTILNDLIKKKNVDIYVIYLQSRSFKGGYLFQKTNLEKILPSLFLSNLGNHPPAIIYIDCFEKIDSNNPYLCEDIKNNLHIFKEVNRQISSYLIERYIH